MLERTTVPCRLGTFRISKLIQIWFPKKHYNKIIFK